MGQGTRHKHWYTCIMKTVVFVVILALLIAGLSRVMTVNSEGYRYSLMTAVYDEPENSLDAVYIGSSNCFVFWNSMAAFREYGITVLPFACDSQPLNVAEYLVKEAVKTHPNALYIININTFVEKTMGDSALHRLLDYLPLSVNKLALTAYATSLTDLSAGEKAEYYFPLLRYHSRWNELSAGNFGSRATDYKNSSVLSMYLENITDVSGDYISSSETAEISDVLTTSIISLLTYLQGTDLNVLFVTVPQARGRAVDVQKYNAINTIIADYGFSTLDLLNGADELGVDFTQDFYNRAHTNVHGSLKFTNYLASYLTEQYQLTDKRGNADYAAWDTALAAYEKKLGAYVLDFEWDSTGRDYSLDAVENVTVKATESGNTVTWSHSDKADGYAVYRKGNDAWSRLQPTSDTAYIDQDIEEGVDYRYTVVPYTEDDNGVYYGNFSYTGVAVTK